MIIEVPLVCRPAIALPTTLRPSYRATALLETARFHLKNWAWRTMQALSLSLTLPIRQSARCTVPHAPHHAARRCAAVSRATEKSGAEQAIEGGRGCRWLGAPELACAAAARDSRRQPPSGPAAAPPAQPTAPCPLCTQA